MKYALAGNRPGFKLDGEITHCADGYTEVRRDGRVVGVYMTSLVTGAPADAPRRLIGETAAEMRERLGR